MKVKISDPGKDTDILKQKVSDALNMSYLEEKKSSIFSEEIFQKISGILFILVGISFFIYALSFVFSFYVRKKNLIFTKNSSTFVVFFSSHFRPLKFML